MKEEPLGSFLADHASQGHHQGEGFFRLNLSKSAHKLAAGALPSRYHYLLKMVQVANLLGAEKIEIKVARASTTFLFQASAPDYLQAPDPLAHALAQPLETRNPCLAALTSALLGTLNPENHHTAWSICGPLNAFELTLDSAHKVEVVSRDNVRVEKARFELRVYHRGSWKFWLGAAGRAESVSLLQHHARFSPARIVIDGSELETPQASVLNDHIVALESFRQISTSRKRARVPAELVYFELAETGLPAVSLLRPSLSAYVIRKNNLNLWASGTRPGNTLLPDGESSAAWVLQFRRNSQNLSMRLVRKRDRFRVVLSYNIDEAAQHRPLKILIVRDGVLLAEKDLLDTGSELEALQGCTLLLADNDLMTDLSGLQLVDTKQLERQISKFRYLKPIMDDYLDRAKTLLNR